MPVAARYLDPISHSSALVGLLAGAAAGLAVVAVGIFVVGTGGAGAVVIAAGIGAAAATGAGIGEVLGSLTVAPTWNTGGIATGSKDTAVNMLLSARAVADIVNCTGTPPSFLSTDHQGKRIAEGSATVSINNMLAARVDDKIECGSKIAAGSPDVFIGGPTQRVLDVDNEVPWYVHLAVLVVGVGAAVVLGGPLVAIAGLVGSTLGGAGAEMLAAKLGFGEDGQKIAGLLGSFVGGEGATRGVKETGLYRSEIAGMKGASPEQIAAREQIASEQEPGSAAAAAADKQGTPEYPGVDPLQNRQYQPGDKLYALTGPDGNPKSGFFMDQQQYDAFKASGANRDDVNQALQIQPNGKYATDANPNGYKDRISEFDVTAPTDAGGGPTVANPKYGAGGADQVFAPEQSGISPARNADGSAKYEILPGPDNPTNVTPYTGGGVHPTYGSTSGAVAGNLPPPTNNNDPGSGGGP